MNPNSATRVWLNNLDYLLKHGETRAPRGIKTVEALGFQSVVDMNYPIVQVPSRKMQHRFMFAEAYWILSGDNTVEGIAPWCPPIAKFSDDGIRFDGAYGPMVVQQVRYCIDCLVRDADTRQAVMTIWRPNPRDSKDIPCTLSLQFLLRDGKLNCIATMRSSDIWLGWVYDVFNFSCISEMIRVGIFQTSGEKIELGMLHLTAGSQHLYESNVKEAFKCIEEADLTQTQKPPASLGSARWVQQAHFMEFLRNARNNPSTYLDELRKNQ